MPRSDLKSRDALASQEQQKPAPKVVHKRRSEDDMRRALADFVAGKPAHRDDEREVILSDAITEVVEMRRIMMEVTQTLNNLSTTTATSVKQILSPQ